MGNFETMTVDEPTARVYSADGPAETPGVVVFHAWWGFNDDVVAYADRVAGSGFAVMAPDMFGGQVASTIEDDRLIHRYPGTGHWFAEPSKDAYKAPAADLAFERTVAFLRRHLGTPTS